MAREFAKEFYNSRAWKECRKAYTKSVGGCCERCERKGFFGVPGEIVHHKKRLSEQNINNPMITLNFDNLELLCRNCHAEEHEADVYGKQRSKRRFTVDANGNVNIL